MTATTTTTTTREARRRDGGQARQVLTPRHALAFFSAVLIVLVLTIVHQSTLLIDSSPLMDDWASRSKLSSTTTGSTTGSSTNSTWASPTMLSDTYTAANTKRAASDFPISICVVVRTYYGQSADLPILLDSLVVERHRQETLLPNLTTQVFLVDTEPVKQNRSLAHNNPYAQSFEAWLFELQRRAQARAGRPVVHIMEPTFKLNKTTYGYDATNFVLDYLRSHQREHQCTHYMFTNGDNYYVPSLWRDLQRMLPQFDFMVWDFLTRYPFQHNSMSVQYTKGRIDLGTFIIHSDYLLKKPGLHFGYLAESDYFFIHEAIQNVPKAKRKQLHQVRMAHN